MKILKISLLGLLGLFFGSRQALAQQHRSGNSSGSHTTSTCRSGSVGGGRRTTIILIPVSSANSYGQSPYGSPYAQSSQSYYGQGYSQQPPTPPLQAYTAPSYSNAPQSGYRPDDLQHRLERVRAARRAAERQASAAEARVRQLANEEDALEAQLSSNEEAPPQ